MFVVDGGSVDVSCCISDFRECTAVATGSFQGARVGEGGCWVCAECTIECIRWIDIL